MPQKDTCLHRLYLMITWPAETHGPAAFVHLSSTYKKLGFSNRLNKSQEHFGGVKQALQGKNENCVTPLFSLEPM